MDSYANGAAPRSRWLHCGHSVESGVLGDAGINREIDRIATFADGAPVSGFYTYGEIARTTGWQGFHNQTLVVLALG